MLRRGDVVVVDFPQGPGQPPKRRPAVVVQSDQNNRRLANSIFAMVTSNIRLADKESSQFLIDIRTTDGRQSGLIRTSAVKCENLFTLPVGAVKHTIGHLSGAHLKNLDASLKASLGIK